MATATTPTRARSVAPSPSRSSRSAHRAMSRGDIPSSPMAARINDGDIPIDPALLADGSAELLDDLDAEGEVDDGVEYYMPPEGEYYYPQPTSDGTLVSHLPSPVNGNHYPFLPDMPVASSTSGLIVPNGFDLGSASRSVTSPLSNGSNPPAVKRKRGRPRKDGTTGPRVNGTAVNKTPSVSKPPVVNKTPRQLKISSKALPNPRVTPVRKAPPTGHVHPITPETVCSLCGGTESRNRDGHREKMVSCVKCGRSGHPTCLGITNPTVVKKMRSYEWYCIECKPCEVCLDKGEDHKLLFCDGCDRGWHSYCLDPPLSAPPKGMWYCPMCSDAHKPVVAASSSKASSSKALSSKASSSKAAPAATPSSSRKGKGRAVEDEGTPKPLAGPPRKKATTSNGTPIPDRSTPKLKLKANGVKDKDKDRDKDRDTEKKDRKRPHAPSEPDLTTPTSIVVRLRVPSSNRKDVQVEEEEEQVPYGGVLTGNDADTSHTTITQADKDLYNKSLKSSEARLGGPPPPLWDPQAMIASPAPPSRSSTPGPSKPTPAKATPTKATPVRTTPTATPGTATPITVSRSLRDRVLLQQTASLGGITSTPATNTHDGTPTGRPQKISKIRFGTYDIDTWYTAPYPEEYAQVPDGRLFLCEFCLKYMKSGFVAGRHRMKCKSRHPPGDEIYRDGAISVFEVDGRKNKIYCQNLCLLAKMFLDHKTLYYDVEPFLFYVMTEVDEMGARFVGYFSKEKRTPQNNVSCIMTLPVRQRKGWGQLLIDFSYLLSKKEGRVGSPERPLSGLGALSYKSYWRLTVYKYLAASEGPVTLDDISAATSMTLADIYNTLKEVDMITIFNDDPSRKVTVRPKGRRGRPPKNSRPVEHGEVLGVAYVEGDKGSTVKLPTRYEITPKQDVIEMALNKHDAKGYLTLKPERLKYTPFLVSRDPIAPPPIAAAVTGDRTQAVGRHIAPSETPSSGNKEVIATPTGPQEPYTPVAKDKVAAGQDQATLDLVAALSASPGQRNLRRRSIASSERPQKRRRSTSATTPNAARRHSIHSEADTPTHVRKLPAAGRPRRVIVDPDEEEWGDEDAEGEDDDEYMAADDGD